MKNAQHLRSPTLVHFFTEWRKAKKQNRPVLIRRTSRACLSAAVMSFYIARQSCGWLMWTSAYCVSASGTGFAATPTLYVSCSEINHFRLCNFHSNCFALFCNESDVWPQHHHSAVILHSRWSFHHPWFVQKLMDLYRNSPKPCIYQYVCDPLQKKNICIIIHITLNCFSSVLNEIKQPEITCTT